MHPEINRKKRSKHDPVNVKILSENIIMCLIKWSCILIIFFLTALIFLSPDKALARIDNIIIFLSGVTAGGGWALGGKSFINLLKK